MNNTSLYQYYLKQYRHQKHHIRRLSKKSVQFSLILVGASLVSMVSIVFAYFADLAIELNAEFAHEHPWLPWLLLPFGLPLLRFAVNKLAPYAVGSGIPQVIASLNLPENSQARKHLVSFLQAFWKIPLTFLALLIGASVGREGPSVQVGAAVMYGWGKLCYRFKLPMQGFRPEEWIVAGAAGGLAAAFNAPLAGVIFAIEELGRSTHIMWQRVVLLGVLASGFLVVAISGNNPYFGTFEGTALEHDMLMWVAICVICCGLAGGVFARLLSKGYLALAPIPIRKKLAQYPYLVAFALGLIVAFIGFLTDHQSFGTSYNVAHEALNLQTQDLGWSFFGLSKIIATVSSYWTGIAGGIFTPSLTAGAGIGIHLSTLFHMENHQDVIVLLCMAAFLAAATQSPITSAVVVMEMVGSQPMLFWLMVTSIAAAMISKQVCPQPFYHHMALRFRQRAMEEDRRYAEKQRASKEAEQKEDAAIQAEIDEALHAVGAAAPKPEPSTAMTDNQNKEQSEKTS